MDKINWPAVGLVSGGARLGAGGPTLRKGGTEVREGQIILKRQDTSQMDNEAD